MQDLKISNAIKIVEYSSSDFIDNNKKIYDYLFNISKAYNSSEFIDYLDNLNGDIFLQDKKIFVYVLFERNEPLSFAVFSKISNTCVELDGIYTAYGYVKLGFATILIRTCAIMLKKSNINQIVFSGDGGQAFESLINSFKKVEGVKTTQVKNKVRCEIKDINSENLFLQVKELAIK